MNGGVLYLIIDSMDAIIMKREIGNRSVPYPPNEFDEQDQSARNWTSILSYVNKDKPNELFDVLNKKFPFFKEKFKTDILGRADFYMWWQREVPLFTSHMRGMIDGQQSAPAPQRSAAPAPPRGLVRQESAQHKGLGSLQRQSSMQSQGESGSAPPRGHVLSQSTNEEPRVITMSSRKVSVPAPVPSPMQAQGVPAQVQSTMQSQGASGSAPPGSSRIQTQGEPEQGVQAQVPSHMQAQGGSGSAPSSNFIDDGINDGFEESKASPQTQVMQDDNEEPQQAMQDTNEDSQQNIQTVDDIRYDDTPISLTENKNKKRRRTELAHVDITNKISMIESNYTEKPDNFDLENDIFQQFNEIDFQYLLKWFYNSIYNTYLIFSKNDNTNTFELGNWKKDNTGNIYITNPLILSKQTFPYFFEIIMTTDIIYIFLIQKIKIIFEKKGLYEDIQEYLNTVNLLYVYLIWYVYFAYLLQYNSDEYSMQFYEIIFDWIKVVILNGDSEDQHDINKNEVNKTVTVLSKAISLLQSKSKYTANVFFVYGLVNIFVMIFSYDPNLLEFVKNLREYQSKLPELTKIHSFQFDDNNYWESKYFDISNSILQLQLNLIYREYNRLIDLLKTKDHYLDIINQYKLFIDSLINKSFERQQDNIAVSVELAKLNVLKENVKTEHEANLQEHIKTISDQKSQLDERQSVIFRQHGEISTKDAQIKNLMQQNQQILDDHGIQISAKDAKISTLLQDKTNLENEKAGLSKLYELAKVTTESLEKMINVQSNIFTLVDVQHGIGNVQIQQENIDFLTWYGNLQMTIKFKYDNKDYDDGYLRYDLKLPHIVLYNTIPNGIIIDTFNVLYAQIPFLPKCTVLHPYFSKGNSIPPKYVAKVITHTGVTYENDYFINNHNDPRFTFFAMIGQIWVKQNDVFDPLNQCVLMTNSNVTYNIKGLLFRKHDPTSIYFEGTIDHNNVFHPTNKVLTIDFTLVQRQDFNV